MGVCSFTKPLCFLSFKGHCNYCVDNMKLINSEMVIVLWNAKRTICWLVTFVLTKPCITVLLTSPFVKYFGGELRITHTSAWRLSKHPHLLFFDKSPHRRHHDACQSSITSVTFHTKRNKMCCHICLLKLCSPHNLTFSSLYDTRTLG